MCIAKTEVIKYINKNNCLVTQHLLKHNIDSRVIKNRKQKIIELKKVSDLWFDKSGSYVYGWETEKCKKNYAIKGTFMNKVINELFYICLDANDDEIKINKLIESSSLNTEIRLYLIICSVVNLPYNFFLFNSNKEDQSRKYIEHLFSVLTNDTQFWNKLEYLLDSFTSTINKSNLNEIKSLLDKAREYSKSMGNIPMVDNEKYIKRLSIIK